MAEDRKPIGYWVKHVDGLIERHLDSALAADAVSRREWQVLNLLDRAAASEAAVVEALRPFWTPGARSAADVLQGLAARGWSERDGSGSVRLTPAGAAARAALAERVQAFRTAMTAGIAPAQHAATVESLRLTAENLDARAERLTRARGGAARQPVEEHVAQQLEAASRSSAANSGARASPRWRDRRRSG
jgi:hypothetical protein